MASLHKLRRLGANETGEKAGVELPRDDLRAEGLLDEEGNLTGQPEVLISRTEPGHFEVELFNDGAEDGAA